MCVNGIVDMPAYRTPTSRQDRAFALVAVAAVHAGLLLLLLSEHQRKARAEPPVETALIEIDDAPTPPPPATAPRQRQVEGAAGKTAKPTEVVAPPARLPAPSPVAAAPTAGNDASPASGAASAGNGTGAGGSGTGAGGGGTAAQWISGGLRDSDYPPNALRERLGGTVSIRFTVLTSGRIADCRVVRSSGNGSLDSTTCRLLTERLRFRPATNAVGQPIESRLGSDYTWGVRVRR
jgi:protein TonB